MMCVSRRCNSFYSDARDFRTLIYLKPISFKIPMIFEQLQFHEKSDGNSERCVLYELALNSIVYSFEMVTRPDRYSNARR